jgi:hypothetical protein
VATFDRTAKLVTAYRTTVEQVSSDTVQQRHAPPSVRPLASHGTGLHHRRGRAHSVHTTSRSTENRRDLGRRSDRIRGTFAKVRELPAQDPAYRPTRLAAPTLAVVTQDPDALDAPFRVRTSVDCAAIASCWRTRYPRSTPHRDRSCRDPCNHACPVVCQRIRSTQGRRFMSGSLSTHPVRRENSAT